MNIMKKISVVLLSMVFVIGLAACSSNSADHAGSGDGDTSSGDKQYTLRIAHILPENSATHIALERFKKDVEEKTDQITVQIYANGQLYTSEASAIEAVKSGALEATVTATSPAANLVPKWAVLDLPFLFDSPAMAYEALDGELGSKLSEMLPEVGLRGLAFGAVGMRQIANNEHPIKEPEDLKGLKIRTLQNKMQIDVWKNYGANAQPFAIGELYSALQQHTFDALEDPFNLLYQLKFYEVVKYLTISNHQFSATEFFMNNDLYESMPEDLQKIIDEAANDYRDFQREQAKEENEKDFEILKDHMKVNKLTPEQRQAFIDATQPIYDKYGKEIGEELTSLAVSYRKQGK